MFHWAHFQPGDNVRIVQETFAGMTGRIISLDEALRRDLSISNSIREGESYWVVTKIFGRDVPVELEPYQMAPVNE